MLLLPQKDLMGFIAKYGITVAAVLTGDTALIEKEIMCFMTLRIPFKIVFLKSVQVQIILDHYYTTTILLFE